MTSAFSWQNSISLCPASFCTPRPNLPVTPGISWLPTFAFQSPIMKRTSFLGVSSMLSRLSCVQLCDSVDHSLAGSSAHGILQARILEWVAISFSRNTWRDRQIWPWSTEWGRAKANRVLPRECTDHSKHPVPTTHEKTLHKDITTWPTLTSDRLYSLQPKMEKLYTVKKNKTRSWLWLRSWTPYCQIQT